MTLQRFSLFFSLFTLFFAGCTGEVIIRDNGGVVHNYSQKYKELEAKGVQVRVEGYCASACVLVLTVKNMCYTPESLFVFHGSTNNKTGEYDPSMSNALLKAMPEGVRKWATKVGAFTSNEAQIWITGKELAKIDGRLC